VILKHTVLKVSDNSGARFVKCIGIQKYKKCKQVSFKTVITVTLTKVKLDKLNESVYLKRVREIRKEEKKKNDAKKRALRESADRDGKNNIEEKIEVKKVQVPKQIVVDFKNTYLKQLYKGLIVTTKKT
jgi:ribosomal protein L14